MKKCVKCNTKYTDDVKFCSSCGSKLEKIDLKKEKDNSKTGNVLRYVFGGIIILVNLMRIEDIGLIAILGFIFAISIFPLPYDLIFKKKEETKKTKFLLSLILPIVLGLVWLIIVPAEKLKEITINNLKDPIAVNETVQIDFDTNLTNIEGKKFKYESSNPEIAIINEKGEITGIADGTVTITISGENDIKTDKEVTIKYIEIDTIELAGDTQVEVGTTGKLTYSTSPEKVSDKIVRWESSNPEIVSVNEKGEITGVSQGKVTISAISEKEKRGEV